MARPTLSLQAAIGDGVASGTDLVLDDAALGLLDTGTLGDVQILGQGSWEEIGTWARRISVARGRQRQLDQFQAGVMSAELDNKDRRFDPTWTAGPYTSSGVSNLRSNRAIRLSARWGGFDYPIFYGFVDNWPAVYEYPEGGLSTVTATDAFKIFTRINPLEQTPVGANEATGARINRILDEAGWPALQRDIDTGNSTHAATNLAQPIATQLRLAGDSERGEVFIAPTGYVTFRERMSRLSSPRSLIVQWVFGDGSGEHNPSAIETANDDTVVRNDVNVARAGGSVITRQNSDGVSAPTRVSYSRSDLTLADDTQVAGHAEHILWLFGDTPAPRIESVTFIPDGNDDLWPLVLGAGTGDRVTVTVRHPYDSSEWSQDYFIESVEHTIGVLERDEQWITTFQLSDASRHPTAIFILDTSVLDTGVLGAW